MVIARKIDQARKFLRKYGRKDIGFVPTMGDLHEGHLSLVRRSKRENPVTAVSIFVNPTQFNEKRDFQLYHRNERRDLSFLKKEGVDLVFMPSAKEMYPEGFQTQVEVPDLTRNLCGPFRPGHFRGVATMVAKLFNIVQPARAYFGRKDYQQLKVIERMARDLDFPLAVIACPTVRERDALAMSSRNRRLSASERRAAAALPRALQAVRDLLKSKKGAHPGGIFSFFVKKLGRPRRDVDYLEIVHPETLKPLKKFRPPCLIASAVWMGKTRLIDNLLVRSAEEEI